LKISRSLLVISALVLFGRAAVAGIGLQRQSPQEQKTAPLKRTPSVQTRCNPYSINSKPGTASFSPEENTGISN
jgi:hypothetical protein